MENILKRGLLTAALLLFALPAGALEKLENVPGLWGVSADFGMDSDWINLSRRGSTVEKTLVHRTVTNLAGGGVKVEVTGDKIHTLTFYQKNGSLSSTDQSNERLGFQLKISVNADRSKATYLVQTKNQDQVHEVHLTRNHLLNTELNGAMAGAWQAGVRDGLTFKSFSPDGANEADMEFRFIETPRPTSLNEKYDFPQEFKAALAPSQTYVVADMYLTGIAAMFYPHHNYFIFQKNGGKLEMVAYFGGDPAKAEFQFKVK